MIRQRTIRKTVEVEGIGLQKGEKVRLALKSSAPDTGVTFIRTDLPDTPGLSINSLDLGAVGRMERRTALSIGPLEVQTIEHIMAALSGLSIDNVVIESDKPELPGLDGSAKGFVELLKEAGAQDQPSPKRFLEVTEPVWCEGENGAFLAAFPDGAFKVSYTLSYPAGSIGTQFFSSVIDQKIFEREIAPARTFCLEEEAMELLRRGFGKGANHENTLVIGRNGPLKTVPRFPDEPVRHKVLDLIGDLYLAGMAVKGRIVGLKSGHRLNMELVKKLKGRITEGARHG